MPGGPHHKSLRTPDQVNELPKVRQEVVDLGDLTVGRVLHQPGWHWREHIQPRVGGDWCQTRHVGVVIRGRLTIELESGVRFTLEPDDVFDIPPGHDGRVEGDEELEMIEWSGLRSWMGFTGSTHNRVLATLLFTDVVASTETAARLGDHAWHDLLANHYEAVRTAVDRHRGREVVTTGDGVLATFESPAAALHCAVAIRTAATRDGLHVRAGVHVGEVQLVGNDVRGIAVHEAARVMGAAADGEILASELTRMLASASGLEFEERGTHALKGLPGEWPLYAFAPLAPTAPTEGAAP